MDLLKIRERVKQIEAGGVEPGSDTEFLIETVWYLLRRVARGPLTKLPYSPGVTGTIERLGGMAHQYVSPHVRVDILMRSAVNVWASATEDGRLVFNQEFGSLEEAIVSLRRFGAVDGGWE